VAYDHQGSTAVEQKGKGRAEECGEAAKNNLEGRKRRSERI